MKSIFYLHRFSFVAIFALLILPDRDCFSQPTPLIVNFEIVSDSAAVGDGGNAWGGHQCRIVRTKDGVFTAYTVEGGGYLSREWRVAQRSEDGWNIIARGVAGREPVNLLAAPDGKLYIIGWPNGEARMWSLTQAGGSWSAQDKNIRGQLSGNWPYNSAGIDSLGDICVVSSEGGGEPGGAFLWSYYNAAQQHWTYRKTELPFRYCYTYVFPLVQGVFSLVSTRDVRWEALNYTKPENAFDYVFNAFRYWHKAAADAPLTSMAFVEEPPTSEFPNVVCNAQQDAYIDTGGNVHVLYVKAGSTTGGLPQHRHAVFSPQGETIFDGQLPLGAGWYSRIFQDSKERFFLLGDAGLIYLLADDGFTPVDSIQFDLQGYHVEYSGYGISVPRTGTPLSDVLDVVFPANGGKDWIYFSLPLDDLFLGSLIEKNGRALVDQFRLFQNYPNPFNAETIIRYSLKRQSRINIKVYNGSGQKIATLIDGNHPAGEFSIKWNGENDQGQTVATGIYFVRFQAGNFAALKKALFIR